MYTSPRTKGLPTGRERGRGSREGRGGVVEKRLYPKFPGLGNKQEYVYPKITGPSGPAQVMGFLQ